jgi:antitoxin HigA-1
LFIINSFKHKGSETFYISENKKEIIPEHANKLVGILDRLDASISVNDLGVSRKTLSELINEKSSLSPDMAVRISKATKTSPESWLNMQSKLDLWLSEQKDLNVILFPFDGRDQNEVMEG